MTACNLQFAKMILDKAEFEQFKDHYWAIGEHTSDSAFRLACMYAETHHHSQFLRRVYEKRSELYMNYALLIEKLEKASFTEAINKTLKELT